MTEFSQPRQLLRIGTRGSKLARWQAEWVAAQLRNNGRAIEIVEITTDGDTHQLEPVADIGSPGVFTKEIQRAILQGEVDVAVHSLKDLPTEPVSGLVLAAVPPRESPADALVARNAASLAALPSAALVGTGSLRRQAQLRFARPDLQVESIRGNVDTRLRKLEDGQFDAIVLAEAGLKRLGGTSRIAEVLPYDVMLPAAGQGALGIECRTDDADAIATLAALDHAESRAAAFAERSLLAHLRGGCLAPIGALGTIENGLLTLSAVVLDASGSRRLSAVQNATRGEAVALGCSVADELLALGAAELIASCRP